MTCEDCDFSPLESIQAATLNGARVLGIDARTGTIRSGLEADLLIVERDPLHDGSALFEPLVVVSDGCVAFERSWLPPR
jgi:imidazolonepropionase-like amidohydrolase